MNPPAAIRRRPWGLLELALSGLLIAWRCAAPTWHPLWADLFLYLGLYWMLLVLAPAPWSDTWGLLTVMLILLAICLKGQMPHVLLACDLLP